MPSQADALAFGFLLPTAHKDSLATFVTRPCEVAAQMLRFSNPDEFEHMIAPMQQQLARSPPAPVCA